ncbi:alpha/beta hydrolase family protein [Dactylosporangium sp. CS-033363]|uniref:alpha/beta hydrolase family protein n=1 Tax=Dactylosporangium sp. CS-033363 TaxID=3239935 RepID=UPI003D89E265
MQRVARAVAALAAAIAAAIIPMTPSHAEPGAVTSTDVTFTGSGGVVLHGTVLTPTGATGRHPAIVMLEGAGNRGREYLRPGAEAYARQGVVTLIYDKRKVGYSLLHRDYAVLAGDALAGLQLLRARPDVDPARAGLWALSEGAFVAPIAATRSNDVKFLITVGAVGNTPAAQTAWEYDEYLRHAGVSAAVSRALRKDILPAAIDAGLFPEHDFEPAPLWRQVRQPVLAEWGELDRDSVPAESSRIIGDALKAGGNTRYQVRFLKGVNHNLHITAADGFDRLPTLPDNYAQFETAWISSSPDTDGPTSSETAAGNSSSSTDGSVTSAEATALASDSSAEAIERAPWYHRSWPVVVATLLLLAGFLVAPVRLRGGRTRAVWLARWLALVGPAVIVGMNLYFVFLLATAGKVTGPVVFGRPLPWLALELLTVGTAVVAVAAGISWWRSGNGYRNRVRLGLSIGAGVLLLPWVASWGLLVP